MTKRITLIIVALLSLTKVHAESSATGRGYMPQFVNLQSDRIAGTVTEIVSPSIIELVTKQGGKKVKFWLTLEHIDFAAFKDRRCPSEDALANAVREHVWLDYQSFKAELWHRCDQLKDMLVGEDLYVEVTDWHSKGSLTPVIMGMAALGDKIVNYELVKNGYFRYDHKKHDSALSLLEREAFCKRRGLWSQHPNQQVSAMKCKE